MTTASTPTHTDNRSYHVASRGQHKGKYVLCEAKVKCRLQSAGDHIDHETFIKHKNAFVEVDQVFKSLDRRENRHSTPVSPKVKTAYRETAVLFGVLGSPGYTELLQMSSEDYFNAVADKIKPERDGEINSLRSETWKKGEMPLELREAIISNFKLGKSIRGEYYNNIKEDVLPETLKWVGDDTSYAPADILINGHLWSLKENSDIIKNSSTGALMNSIMGEVKYDKVLHALDNFAKAEHDDSLRFAIKEYNQRNPDSKLPEVSSFEEWKKHTPETKKKLSRFITAEAKNNTPFNQQFAAKKVLTSTKAGEEIVKALKTADFSKVSAGSLLAGDKGYFYAKTSRNKKTEKGYIPDATTVDTFVKLKDVKHSPGQQLDLRFVYENNRGEELIVQAEMRYSHGQFFGVPETKMKIFKGSFVDFLKQ